MQLTNEQILAMARMILDQQPSENKVTTELSTTTRNGFLILSTKELNQMPKKFKNQFILDGRHIRYRERKDKNSFSCEIRYRRDGYDISVSATTLQGAKDKFVQKLNDLANGAQNAEKVPKTMREFTEYYFNNFRARKVSKKTLYYNQNHCRNYIYPAFGELPINKITPNACQKLIDKILHEGHAKTAEDIQSLLSVIFKMAIKHGIIKINPVDICVKVNHERKHGKALSKEEEKILLTSAKKEYVHLFAIALYTGMRPNEYKTAKFSEDKRFIIALNSKRKGGKVEYKKIPVTPMLAPYVADLTAIKFPCDRLFRGEFNRIFGDRHLQYDMRTTFYTRLTECGVADAARDEFVGHSNGKLAETYTDLSDEYLWKEGQKFKY